MKLLVKIVGLSPHPPPNTTTNIFFLVSKFFDLAICVGKKHKQQKKIIKNLKSQISKKKGCF
jgi:hypothetical protein